MLYIRGEHLSRRDVCRMLTTRSVQAPISPPTARRASLLLQYGVIDSAHVDAQPPLTLTCSKFAVRSINQGAAIELGKYGITANVYCPTVVETDMWRSIDHDQSKLNGWTEGEYTVNVGRLSRGICLLPLSETCLPYL